MIIFILQQVILLPIKSLDLDLTWSLAIKIFTTAFSYCRKNRFLKNLCFVSFTSCIYTALISPDLCIQSLSLQPPHLNKMKFKRKKKTKEKVKCDVKVIVWHNKSRSKPFYPYIFICKHSLQRGIDLVQGHWFLFHYGWWALLELLVVSHCCPVLWKFCDFWSARLFPSPAQGDNRWSGCWRGPTYNPGSGSG